MADMLADGAAMVADSISSYVSQTVTYTRPGRTPITALKAARGRPVRGVDETTGRLLWVAVKWFIKPSLLVSGIETLTPQKNDVITEANGAEWSMLPDDIGDESVLGSFGEFWEIDSKRTKNPT